MFFPDDLLTTSAQLTNAAVTYYTSPDLPNVHTLITLCTMYNGDTAVRTFTIYKIKKAGTAGVTNIVVASMSLAPGETLLIAAMGGQILDAGDFLQMLADTGAKVTPTLNGVVVSNS